MSDHGHEHDHVHVGFKGATITFILLGSIEILLGTFFANPAVTNLGLHDLSDVILPTMGAFVAFLVIWLEGHFPKCQAEVWVAFGIGISNIVVIGGITLLSIPSSINSAQAILGVGSGIVSYAANRYWSLKLHCHDDEARKAVSDHLRLDALASAAVAVGSTLAFGLNMIWPAVVAAMFVFVMTVKHSVPELRRLSRKFHTKARHL